MSDYEKSPMVLAMEKSNERDALDLIQRISVLKVQPDEVLVVHIRRDQCREHTAKFVGMAFKRLGIDKVLVDNNDATFSVIKENK